MATHKASCATLALAVGLALLLAAATLAGAMRLVNRPDWWRGYRAATAVSVLAAGASMVPTLWGMRGGLARAAAAHMLGALVRGLVSIAGCVLAVLAGDYPPVPTLVLMAGYYMALLAVESAALGRMLWTARL